MSELPGERRTACLVLAGECDLQGAPALRDSLLSLAEGEQPVVVDLGECLFLDGSILDVLLEARHLFRARGLGYVLCVPPTAEPVVRMLVLELTVETAALAVAPSVERAERMALRGMTGSGHATSQLHQDLRERLWEVRASIWRTTAEAEALRSTGCRLLMGARAELSSLQESLARS